MPAVLLLNNNEIAKYGRKNRIPLPYRVQQTGANINVANIPEGAALDYALKTNLKRSETTLRPDVHSSLGLSEYTQASSPIRRYLDLCVHRQIITYLQNQHYYYSEDELTDIIHQASTGLGLAQTVSKDSKRYWQLEYLRHKRKTGNPILGVVIKTEGRNILVDIEELAMQIPVRANRNVTLGEQVKITIQTVDPRRDVLRVMLN
jgi:exoribonuclease II